MVSGWRRYFFCANRWYQARFFVRRFKRRQPLQMNGLKIARLARRYALLSLSQDEHALRIGVRAVGSDKLRMNLTQFSLPGGSPNCSGGRILARRLAANRAFEDRPARDLSVSYSPSCCFPHSHASAGTSRTSASIFAISAAVIRVAVRSFWITSDQTTSIDSLSIKVAVMRICPSSLLMLPVSVRQFFRP